MFGHGGIFLVLAPHMFGTSRTEIAELDDGAIFVDMMYYLRGEQREFFRAQIK